MEKETRIEKTVPMLRYKITWGKVADKLDLTIITLTDWRQSGEPNKNGAIDLAIDDIVKELKTTDSTKK